MADQGDVRRIARTLPGAREGTARFAFSVEGKGKKERGFAWVWLERVHPKKARVPCPAVLAVRVANELEKATLLAADGDTFFTEPHYNGYPAVLVRLANVTTDELRVLLTEAWRCMAAPHLVAQLDGPSSPARPPGTRGAAKRMAPKRTAAKRTVAKSTAAKRTTAKRTTAKRTATKRTVAKRTTAKRTTAKRTAGKRTTAKRTAAKRTAAKRTTAKRTAAKRTTAKRS